MVSHSQGINWDVIKASSGWDPTDIQQLLASGGLWYVNSHGGIDLHDTDVAHDHIEASSYLSARTSVNGSGLPPYNTGAPPFSYAHFCVCNAMGTGFNAVLYPYYTYYEPTAVVDQAVTGWAVFINEYDSADVANAIYSRLADGKTVKQMRDEVISWNGTVHTIKVSTDEVVWTDFNLPVQLPILGDKYTRIKKLYTGSNSVAANVWYE